MDFTTTEKSDILEINKGGDIVSMTPYTLTQIQRMRQEWLEWRPTPLFLLILPNFLCYHIHLPWSADMEINLSEYGHKGINITEIWDAWLCSYLWISPHDHPDGGVDWYSQGPQKWPPLVLFQFLSTQDQNLAVIAYDKSAAFPPLEGWESRGVLGLHPELSA